MTEIDTLKAKAAKQTTEIARLTQEMERTTAETIRRRRLLLSALNDDPGWLEWECRHCGWTEGDAV